MKIHSLASLALVLFLLTGCAFSNTQVVVSPKPPAGIEALKSPVAVTVETLRDDRGVDALLVANKGVGMKTSGKYLSARPVAEIVTECLRESLVAMNCPAGTGNLLLSGTLLRFDSEPKMGFWSGEMSGVVQFNLKLTDRRSGQVVWTDLITGHANKTGLQIDHEGHRKEVAEAALKDAVGKLVTSPAFRVALEAGR
jgi:hypothetical protein